MEAWNNIEFAEDEATVIKVPTTEASDRFKLCLAGKLWGDRPFNTQAFQSTLKQIWRVKHGVDIRILGKNIFTFQFYLWKDMDRVLAGEHWWFDKRVLVLQRMEGVEQPSDLTPTHTPFWVRAYDVPFNLRHHDTIQILGDRIGSFLYWDNDEDHLWGKFVRFRVLVDLKKPLKRGTLIQISGDKPKKGFFKYERLYDFCYVCGCLGHLIKDCDANSQDDDTDEDTMYMFGPWLRASPLRLRSLSMENSDFEYWCEKNVV